MPNFEVQVRSDYRDINGLVLDCRSENIAADGSVWVNTAPPSRALHRGSHTGNDNVSTLSDSTKMWISDQLVGSIVYNLTDGSSAVITGNSTNTVTGTLSGGTQNDWDAGDEYAVTTPRFGNPYQDNSSKRPTVSTIGGYKRAEFDTTNGDFLKIPLDYGFPASNWTVCMDVFFGTSSNEQTILGFPNMKVFRTNSSGYRGYKHNVTTISTTGGMTDGTWYLAFLASSVGRLYVDNTVNINASSSLVSISANDPAGYICTSDGSNEPANVSYRNLQIWSRILSDLERDFAFASLDPETDHSDFSRATVTISTWNDDTASVGRINPLPDAPHRFYHATKPTGTTARIQIAASVNGNVKPDSDLGGSLFSLTPIELPGFAPAVHADSGWSSVFDVLLSDEGHYTYLLSRSDGGGVVVHFDVEDL